MDIQREREVFEKLPEIARHINKFFFQDDLNCYRNKIKSSDIHLVTWVNGAWYSWQAKALAVPEGYVLMPKEPTQNIYRTFYGAFNSADAGNTAQNFKVAYKAMIEAQEST